MALGKLAKKYVNIIILVLIAAGFTLPGALYFGGSDGGNNDEVDTNQRVCQVDAHCYLNCDEDLKSVLCDQNLCTVNNCEVESMYEFSLTPREIILDIAISEEDLILEDLVKEGDFFVQLSGSKVQLYSENLNLNQILEKFNLGLIGNCLSVGGEFLCGDDEDQLILIINGEERFDSGYYVPADGDEISIIYS